MHLQKYILMCLSFGKLRASWIHLSFFQEFGMNNTGMPQITFDAVSIVFKTIMKILEM